MGASGGAPAGLSALEAALALDRSRRYAAAACLKGLAGITSEVCRVRDVPSMNVATLYDQGLVRHGDHPAVWFEGRWHGRGEINDLGHRLAGGLRRLGIGGGDRVMVTMTNRPEVGAVYQGCWIAGAVIVPVLFLLTAEEMSHIARDSDAVAVVTSNELLAKVAEVAAEAPSLRHIISVDEGGGALGIGALAAADPVEAPADVGDEQIAVILYTSGTTGHPKGVELSHGNLRSAAENVHAYWSAGDGQVGLACLPLAHIYGLAASLTATFNKSSVVMMRWFDAGEALRLIEENRVSATALVPAMMVALLAHPDRERRDLSSLEWVVCGASPLPLELLRRFEAAFGCTVLQGYGLSESSAQCSFSVPHANRPGSVGRPVPGVEVAVVDAGGRHLPAGEPGEIVIRGPNVMRGYHGRHEATEAALGDGWLHTGDVGRLDEEGYLYVVDRLKDLIIRGGFNILPRDVEEVLHTHTAVSEAAVIGVPDPRLGEIVHAEVVLAPGASASADELLRHCRQHLAAYKCPASINIVAGLPHTTTGKLLKRQLREEHLRQATVTP